MMLFLLTIRLCLLEKLTHLLPTLESKTMLECARLLGAKLTKPARSKANKRKILLSKLLLDFRVLFADLDHHLTHVKRNCVLKLAVFKLATGVVFASRNESLGL